ncbi:MAG: hypothetical protein NTV94_07480 [Planctomycetota bacterium]|nr:hypothetical protein [Planctomycetota bacterium]
MSTQMPDFRPVELNVTCLHLRHKLMYVDDRQKLPGMVDAESSTRIYFCTRTQEQLGPDDEPVNPQQCCDGRACFRCL